MWTALEGNPMKTCGIELFFRAGHERRYSGQGTPRPLRGLHGATIYDGVAKAQERATTSVPACIFVFCIVWPHRHFPHNKSLPSSWCWAVHDGQSLVEGMRFLGNFLTFAHPMQANRLDFGPGIEWSRDVNPLGYGYHVRFSFFLTLVVRS